MFLGYRSQGHWKVKCNADNTWSRDSFSKCVSCDGISASVLGEGVNMVKVYRKNLPVLKFNCADDTSSLKFKDYTYPKGGKVRQAKCLCKHGQNGDPYWKKSCSWTTKQGGIDLSFDSTDAAAIVCTPNQPDQDALDAANAALDAANAADAEQ